LIRELQILFIQVPKYFRLALAITKSGLTSWQLLAYNGGSPANVQSTNDVR